MERPGKKLTSIRLSAEAERLRAQLASALGVNKTAVLELAIRELARKFLHSNPAPRRREK